MRKMLELNLSELKVESFATDIDNEAIGVVDARITYNEAYCSIDICLLPSNHGGNTCRIDNTHGCTCSID